MSEQVEQSVTVGLDNYVHKPPPVTVTTDGSSAVRDSAVSLDASLKNAQLPGAPSTAVLPLSSNSFGRGGILLHQRRKKGGPMTLYVRSGERDFDGASRNEAKGSPKENSAALHESIENVCESSVFRNALETLVDMMQTVKSVLSNFMELPKNRRLFIPLVVFIFFLVTLIFNLRVAQSHVEWMSRVVDHENGQGLLFASSLTEQLLAKANEAEEFMLPFRRSSPAVVEKMKTSVKELNAFREAGIKQLHSRLAYPGPVEDIQFLVDEHVAYKVNLARLVKEELEWIQEKKRGGLVAQESSNTHSTEPNEGETEEKKYDNGRQQKETMSTAVLQPGSGAPRSLVSSTSMFKLFTSWLTKRTVGIPLIFLLTVIYVRLR